MTTPETSQAAPVMQPLADARASRLPELLKQTAAYVFLVAGAFLSMFPFYYMFVQASQPSSEVLRFPPHLWFGEAAWANIKSLWAAGFGRSMLNSLVIAAVYAALAVLISSLAGYAFAKFSFPGRNALFAMFLLVLMIPYHATTIPLFKMMAAWDWLSTYQAVIIPSLANPWGIFLMRQSMQSIPSDLLDAGRIDGASEWQVFWRVALPTMRPTLAALAIYSFMFQWNSYFWPLVVMRTPEMRTLPVAISSLTGYSIVNWGEVMMSTTLATLPVLAIFLLFQKQFISGAMAGAVKG